MEKPGQDVGRKVRSYSFAEEERRPIRPLTSAAQDAGDITGGEVDGDEHNSVGAYLEPAKPCHLVHLSIGMIQLEPRHSCSGVPEAASVVSRPECHDLVKASVKGSDHDTIEERRPGPEVSGQIAGTAGTGRYATGDIHLKTVVRVWISVGGRLPRK
jgi:hypothetical protein